jgi:uncharacterized membrane protein YkoI
MKTALLAIGSTVLVAVIVVLALGFFNSKSVLSDAATIAMVDAIRTAELVQPGTPVEVDLMKDAGHVVYSVHILDRDNRSHAVYVDALDGTVHAH